MKQYRHINHNPKSGGSGLLKNFTDTVKEILLNRIDSLVGHYIPDEMNEKYRKSIGLRLWSGCLDAAKMIALDTLDGLNTPERRTEIFQTLDHTADQEIFIVPLLNLHHCLKRKGNSAIHSTAFH
jgi:hypothetical protein